MARLPRTSRGGVEGSSNGGIHIFPGFDPDGPNGDDNGDNNGGTDGDDNEGGNGDNQGGDGDGTTPGGDETNKETITVGGVTYTVQDGKTDSMLHVRLTSVNAKDGKVAVDDTIYVQDEQGKGTRYLVTSIDPEAFKDKGITEISVTASLCTGEMNKAISAIDTSSTGSLRVTIKDSSMSHEVSSKAFEGNTAITELVLGNGITGIAGSAFSGCTSLTMVYIPSTVTNIGAWAFNGCSSLTENGVYYAGPQGQWVAYNSNGFFNSGMGLPTPAEDNYNCANPPEQKTNASASAINNLTSLFNML